MLLNRYRIVQERVVVFCKFLQANPTHQPTAPLKLAGPGAAIFFTYTEAEQYALMPVCIKLSALIDQVQE